MATGIVLIEIKKHLWSSPRDSRFCSFMHFFLVQCSNFVLDSFFCCTEGAFTKYCAAISFQLFLDHAADGVRTNQIASGFPRTGIVWKHSVTSSQLVPWIPPMLSLPIISSHTTSRTSSRSSQATRKMEIFLQSNVSPLTLHLFHFLFQS